MVRGAYIREILAIILQIPAKIRSNLAIIYEKCSGVAQSLCRS